MQKIDKFIKLADAMFSVITGDCVCISVNSCGKLSVSCPPADFFKWFVGFETISLYEYYDGFMAEVKYLDHFFVSCYPGVCSYEDSL